MATMSTTPTATSLSISSTTSVSGTISWTCPTIPEGCTITSCVLTGTPTFSMKKGSATVTVNGTTVTSGTQFTINLGTANTTKSVSTTGEGNNKNASGTVTFTSLSYVVTYEEPKTMMSNVFNGSINITDIRVGNEKIIKIYIDNIVIYENL